MYIHTYIHMYVCIYMCTHVSWWQTHFREGGGGRDKKDEFKCFLFYICHISKKSCCGEILFQGPVLCGNNSWAAIIATRLQGWHLQRSTSTRVRSFDCEPICMHIRIMHIRVHTSLLTLYHVARIQWRHSLVGWNMQWDFKVQRDFEEMRWILIPGVALGTCSCILFYINYNNII